MSFTFGSLFSGIGGIDLGLERAGMQCAWQVEIDEYASKVLQKHWPNVARFRDIRTVGRVDLEAVDLIAGGFPCQDISGAGKRAGITGERSGLWSEFYRIICELRPRYVLVENVAALLYPIKRKRNGRVVSIEHAPIGRVLGDLASCGYDAEWQILSAAAFGAPHIRERVFIIAYPARNGCEGREYQPLTRKYTCSPIAGTDGNRQQMADTDGARCQEFNTAHLSTSQGHATWRKIAPGVENATSRRERLYIFPRTQKGTQPILEQSSWWTTEPELGRVANGVPARMDRLTGLGNAVVPQLAEFVGRCILEREKAA